MKQEVAIIGYGRFGRVAARFLKKHFTVFVADKKTNVRGEAGIKKLTVKEAAQKKTVILAVPINKLPTTLKAIRPYIKPGVLIIDVCSVKEQPVQWMKQYLPKDCSILGTHPLFGPDSVDKTLKAKSIVLCPVRISNVKLQTIKLFLAKRGLNVYESSPRKHDQIMALTMFLTQFIGRSVWQLHLSHRTFTTVHYDMLTALAEASGNDSLELFKDMYRYNRFARTIPRRVRKQIQKLSSYLAET
ncbi:MAG: prephenate dehydrogenase/arogenate dehydrogenase family protein [Ignavibacteriae bacterium]|nr:prephenate dehydrogenase/arogenate dehydrogenase family protein [Ignavibacteriota bacterium]